MGKPGSERERLEQKRLAAEHAAGFVTDGMTIGLGSGSTAEMFVRALAPRVATGLRLRCVASSARTATLARGLGLSVGDLDGPLDLAVDGADAIERTSLHAIKGLGGALTREKLVAQAAARFMLVGDDSKLVERLSDRLDLPVPVEILLFGWRLTLWRLAALGDPAIRQRQGEPFITDHGNLVADLYRADLRDPAALATTLTLMPGVVEHGLFLSLATCAVVAGTDGVLELTADDQGATSPPPPPLPRGEGEQEPAR
jgi:ribose 5-phosphate isomerase A